MRYLRRELRRQVETLGLRPFAQAFGVPVGQVRSVCDGRAARSDTIERLTDALGLELYVGPPRPPDGREDEPGGALPRPALRELEASARTLNRVVAEAGGDPVPDDLWPVLAARRGGPARAEEEDEPAGEDAGGAGFGRDWLEGRRPDPARYVAIRVGGGSMEPLLREGDWVLVDRRQRRRAPGRIFVVRTGDGLAIGRAGRGDDGGWLLIGERPSWEPVPWPADAETVGQAVWAARSLV